MKLSSVLLSTYHHLAIGIRESRILNYRFGHYTVRAVLSAASWQLLRQSVPNPLQVDGHRLFHTGQPYALTMASGLLEPETVLLFRRLLKPGMTFVDVGAHIGWYSLIAACAVGENGRVYAFEPDPSNFDLLKKNIVVNDYEGRAILVRKAVSETAGVVSLFPGKDDSGGSSLYATPGAGTRSVEVETITLDDFFAKQNWPKVDLMKMDIEGAESRALRGMAELSRRNPDLKLIIEYSLPNLQAAGIAPQQLFDVLKHVGFRRKSIISRQLIPVDTPADIPRYVPKVTTMYANLLCEK